MNKCPSNAVDPRISPADIEAAIATRYDTTVDKAVGPREATHMSLHTGGFPLEYCSVCIVVMKSGFIVIGKECTNFGCGLRCRVGPYTRL
jgi:hypothetical protein